MEGTKTTPDNFASVPVDKALYAWNRLYQSPSAVMDTWTLPMFISKVFPDWETVVILQCGKTAGFVVRHGDLVLAVPLYWPKGNAETIETKTSGIQVALFDSGLTSCAFGVDLFTVVEDLVETDELVTGTTSHRLAVLVAIEAVILAAPEPDQDGMRMLLALRDLTLPVKYTRII